MVENALLGCLHSSFGPSLLGGAVYLLSDIVGPIAMTRSLQLPRHRRPSSAKHTVVVGVLESSCMGLVGTMPSAPLIVVENEHRN